MNGRTLKAFIMEEQMMQMEQRLWELIDGQSTPTERSALEELIRTQKVWKEKYAELLELNLMLHQSELDAPSMRFTKNVMEEIARIHIAPATRTYINKKIIFGIAGFFLVLILGFLIYGFGLLRSEGTPEINVVSSMPEVGKVNWTRIFSNNWVNAFMVVNIVIGFFLLDNYLGKKRKEMRGENI